MLDDSQAYWGTAVDIAWAAEEEQHPAAEEEQHPEALQLTAAAPLKAKWKLQQQQLMNESSFESLLLDWGIRAAADAMQGMSVSC